MAATDTKIPELIEKNEPSLVKDWAAARAKLSGVGETEDRGVTDLSRRFIQTVVRAAQEGRFDDITGDSWRETREVLEEISRNGALRGRTPSQTATFVLSLKEPLFMLLRAEFSRDAQRLASETWVATLLLDKLALYTVELVIKNREDMIGRQQQELLELSTPVVRLWDGILALPLIGTLDSARTQIVMESLLQTIVTTGAEIAIIDITGVPTVDTLVAQHLLKTVSAARLMGAECLISGIRPQIAQTIVHLGVELDVVSKATMADAFALALRRTGKAVVARADHSVKRAPPDTSAADAE